MARRRSQHLYCCRFDQVLEGSSIIYVVSQASFSASYQSSRKSLPRAILALKKAPVVPLQFILTIHCIQSQTLPHTNRTREGYSNTSS